MVRIDERSAHAGSRDRCRAFSVSLLSLIAAVTAGGCLPDGNQPRPGPLPSEPTVTAANAAGSAMSIPPTPTSTASSPPVPVTPSSTAGQEGRGGSNVRSVIDGDTLVLEDARHVRLAQVDAPETHACFGSQSTQALRALVEGRTVTVRRPENGPERDRYGRTLGEVAVEGRSVNEELVRSGAAGWYEQFANEDPELAARLRAAEIEAKKAKAGLWSICASPTSSAAAPPSTQALVPAGTKCHPAYPGDCIPPAPPDLDCGDIKRRVHVDHTHGDPHRLDADSDGSGCESYG